MEADKAYSTEAQKLIGRLLRLMRREYSDGCRGSDQQAKLKLCLLKPGCLGVLAAVKSYNQPIF